MYPKIGVDDPPDNSGQPSGLVSYNGLEGVKCVEWRCEGSLLFLLGGLFHAGCQSLKTAVPVRRKCQVPFIPQPEGSGFCATMVSACAWLHLRLNGLFQTGAHMALVWYQQVRQLVMYFLTG